MSCRSCGSEIQAAFGAEMNIHFPGRKGEDTAAVLAYPTLAVCVNCGSTEFTLAESALRRLREGFHLCRATAKESR